MTAKTEILWTFAGTDAPDMLGFRGDDNRIWIDAAVEGVVVGLMEHEDESLQELAREPRDDCGRVRLPDDWTAVREVETLRDMPMPDDTPITIVSDEHNPHATTLGALCAEDDFAAENREEIEAALSAGEEYREGGGACPEFVVSLRKE